MRMLDEVPPPTIEVRMRPAYFDEGSVPDMVVVEYRIDGGELIRREFDNG